MRIIRVSVFLLLARTCFGQGFLFDAFDARSLGMASAPFAAPADASDLFLNPASCAYMRGLYVDAGAMMNIRNAEFALTKYPGATPTTLAFYSNSTSNGTEGFPLGNFVYSPQQLPFGIGIGVNEPYQFHTYWQSQWAGSSIAHQSDGHSIFTTLSLGYQFSRMFYAGANIHVVTGGVNLLSINNGNTIQSLGSGTSAAAGFSLLFIPVRQISVAIGYMSGTNISLQGTTQEYGNSTSSAALPTGDYHSAFSLPSILTIGVASRPVYGLTLEAGVEVVGWGALNQLQNNYGGDSNYTVLQTNFQNSFSVRFGAEYVIQNAFAFRAGVRYISAAVSDSNISPFFPDADAVQFSLGLGYYFSRNVRFDLAYQGSVYSNTNATLFNKEGAYSITQTQIAATISLIFEPTSNPLRSPLPKR